jgi:hypothetical protein
MRPRLPQPEVVIGRSVALCVHPYAAWRSQSTAVKLFVFTAYMVTSYAVWLGLMFVAF